MGRGSRLAVLWVVVVGCSPNDGDSASTLMTTDAEPVTTGSMMLPTTTVSDVTTGSSTQPAGTTAVSATDATEPVDTTGTTDSDATTTDTDAATTGEPVDVGWRSSLYPQEWSPGYADRDGRFLHDFSYAGYRNGEAELGLDVPALEIDVVADHGAVAGGEVDATAAFQAALTAAGAMGGAVVTVPPGLYRLDGKLLVQGSRVVLRGAGADASQLWFTQHQGMGFGSHLMFAGNLMLTGDVLLMADAAALGHEVSVADTSGLQPGDDIAIGWQISPEFIEEHGMTGTWMAFNNTWQVFFWRTVVAVEGNTVVVDVPLRYPAKMRDNASVRKVSGYLREVGVESLGFANAVGWDDAWAQNQVHVLSLRGVKDAWVRDVASFESPGAPANGLGSGRHLQSSGIEVERSKRVTVADSVMAWPQHRGGGGNGYLFEVRQSSEVLIRDCIGEAGRHNFIQNWGFGATGIVWLRIHSFDGVAVALKDLDFGLVGLSEFHHSLATANLIDQSTLDDGWGAVNRGSYSSGAGHSATQSVVWAPRGKGVVRSRQFGWGYVIDPGPTIKVETGLGGNDATASEPEDFVEHAPQDAMGPLQPPSLYVDQLARRLGRP